MVKTRRIGSKFSLCHLKYEVREGLSCFGCSFFIEEENVCVNNHRDVTGACSNVRRVDNKDVIFVNIGEQ